MPGPTSPDGGDGTKTSRASLTVATLGGPETFAGQAAARMRELYPFLDEPSYVADGEALFAALDKDVYDAIVAAEAGTSDGYTDFMDALVARPDSGFYVLAEAALPFGCAILGRAGSDLGTIHTVYGGPVSLQQAAPYLARELPKARTEEYAAPLPTAHRIAEGSGDEAVLGTPLLAERFGLTVLASDVDGGACGNFWALSRRRRLTDEPNRVVVAGRLSGDGSLGRLVVALADIGFRLLTVYAQPSGEELFQFNHVLRFAGAGRRADVEAVVAMTPGTRVAGAFVAPPGS